jgi:hypothetical protein
MSESPRVPLRRLPMGAKVVISVVCTMFFSVAVMVVVGSIAVIVWLLKWAILKC